MNAPGGSIGVRRWLGAGLGLAILGPAILGLAGAAVAEDRHAGYYYPPPQTVETYQARTQTLADSDKTRRIGFVVQLTRQMLHKPYPPDYAVFAKGDDAEKLLIVALKDGVIDTLYRARALLAMLTAVARGTPLFAQIGGEETLTFFDLMKMLGFTQLTISDGDAFALQVVIE
jgi:hypothetical protein